MVEYQLRVLLSSDMHVLKYRTIEICSIPPGSP